MIDLPDETAGLVGRRIGPYRIVRLVSHGGMGSVWEAEQEEPRRKVALKTMHEGLTSPVARQRFRFESELLARLRHPGIAQVYEAGVAGAGDGSPSVPWFALEFVEGARSITEYAEQEGLDLGRRLELMLEVCSAMQHAHQRGVLHRDLKPANLLVDESGYVKVIDFGIARPRRTDEATPALTRTGEILGTLEAMSPEQLEGRHDEIDARTDVYALGTVLYELVCGRKPFDLAGLSLVEAVLRIKAQEPVPASRLRPRVPREIDWICARALAKVPDLRYASVGELARDLECFLRGEPVLAGPVSAVYRLRKLVGRNKAASAVALLALVSLVAGLIGTSASLVRARRAEKRLAEERTVAVAEATRANAMLGFLVDGLAQPRASAGPDLRMVDFLADLAGRIDPHFGDETQLRGLLHRAVGRAFYHLGESSDGGEALERSVEALRAAGSEGAAELPATLADLAVLRTTEGRFEEAEELFEEARTRLEDRVGPEHPELLHLEGRRALLHLACGRVDEAEAGLRRALDAVVSADQEPFALAISLGLVHQRAGRLDEAEAVYTDALRLATERLGPQAPIVLSLRLNLAMVDQARGDLIGATSETEHVVREFRRLLGDEHEDTLNAINNLGALYILSDRGEDAAELWNAALASVAGRVSDTHPLVQGLRSNLGYWELRDGGDPERALELLAPVYDWRLAEWGDAHDRTLQVAYLLSWALIGTGRPSEAREILESSRAALRATQPERHFLLPQVELTLARARIEEGDHDAAAMLIDEMLAAFADGRRDTSKVTPADVRALRAAHFPTGPGLD